MTKQKTITSLIVVIFSGLLLLPLTVNSQDSDSSSKISAEKEKTTVKSESEEKPKPEKVNKSFDPTEEISEDLSVPFPTDI